jgi:hypothetical protein
MQLLLWCTLIDWLVIFCIARTMFGKDMVSWDRYCSSSSTPRIKREISCVVNKGEKQIQILDGH